jgi:hypothetical protein
MQKRTKLETVQLLVLALQPQGYLLRMFALSPCTSAIARVLFS